jgi:hypothetical protein
MRKVGPQTSMILTREYLNSPDPNVSQTIAKNCVKARAVELAPEMMANPSANVRFWGTELIDHEANPGLLKQWMSVSSYPDVQEWLAAKVPAKDPHFAEDFAEVKKRFPAIARWKLTQETPTDLRRQEHTLA